MKTMQRISAAFLTLLMVVTMLPSEAFSAFAATELNGYRNGNKDFINANDINQGKDLWTGDNASDPFGVAKQFGITTFNDLIFTNTFGHVETNAAVGGKIQNIRDSLVTTNSNAFPLPYLNLSLVLGGDVVNTVPDIGYGYAKIGNIAQGDVIAKNDNVRWVNLIDKKHKFIAPEFREPNLSHGFYENAGVSKYFQDAHDYLTASQTLLLKLESNCEVEYSANNILENVVTFNATQKGCANVFDYTPKTAHNTFNFNVDDNSSAVIIRVHADDIPTQAEFLNCSSMYYNGTQIQVGSKMPQNILWVFDKAITDIPLNFGPFAGSILAPDANIRLIGASASLNGTIVAKEFTASMGCQEIHWVPFKGNTKVTPEYNNINFTKVDSANEKALDGAEFTLYTTKNENG
ncbi:MAG: choice-of-anchor A family protein, partial [Oscillospiraceae bacterium]